MKLKNFTKKKAVAAGLAFGVAAGAGGIAAAYFAATGTGTGNAQTGHATPFVVTQKKPISGYLYPGQSEKVSFTIQNVGHGIQHFAVASTDVFAAMNGTGTIITAFQKTNGAVPGCKASWFTTNITSGASGTLNPGASDTLVATVHMSNGTSGSSTQNACQTTFPKLTVAFSGPAGFGLFESEGGTAKWTGKTTATLSIPAGAPAYVSTTTAAGAGAGIEVLNPPAKLPTTAPTFTTNAFALGSPRWVIVFTTGKHVAGYPNGAPAATANKWTGPTVPYGSSWTVVTTKYGANTVKQAFIVMTTGQTLNRLATQTDTITNVTYGGLKF